MSLTALEPKHLGMLLKKAGYVSRMKGKARVRGWLVYERSMDEVNANRRIEGKGEQMSG